MSEGESRIFGHLKLAGNSPNALFGDQADCN